MNRIRWYGKATYNIFKEILIIPNRTMVCMHTIRLFYTLLYSTQNPVLQSTPIASAVMSVLAHASVCQSETRKSDFAYLATERYGEDDTHQTFPDKWIWSGLSSASYAMNPYMCSVEWKDQSQVLQSAWPGCVVTQAMDYALCRVRSKVNPAAQLERSFDLTVITLIIISWGLGGSSCVYLFCTSSATS